MKYLFFLDDHIGPQTMLCATLSGTGHWSVRISGGDIDLRSSLWIPVECSHDLFVLHV